jgi:triosephosphate isomerase
MPTPCFVANWKMNKTIAEAIAWLREMEKHQPLLPERGWEVILAAPFTLLCSISEFLKTSSLKIGLAAQNVHFEEKGAYTGEISPLMLRDVGCRYVIIGHSERRLQFWETDLLIRQKIKGAQKAGLIPILCVGETRRERKEGKTIRVINHQLKKALRSDDPQSGATAGSRKMILDRFIIAYEPVWAIGTGETPTPPEVESVHRQIRSFFKPAMGEAASDIPILYGGSVTEKNIEGFMKEPDVDGALVGGASLSAESFYKMIDRGVKAKIK